MKQRLKGEYVDAETYRMSVRQAVKDIVNKQAEHGIDIVTDGEMSKPGFFAYVTERLEGFEPRPGKGQESFRVEREAFPEYYEGYFKRAMYGAAISPSQPMYCVGPIRYCGYDVLRMDLDNLKAALINVPHVEAFIACVAPTGVGYNDYYNTEEEYLFAVADALREEYRAVIEAGFLLQIDDPFLTKIFVEPGLDDKQKDKEAAVYVEVVNYSLQGIPNEKVRYHICYGINEGPRIHEADFSDVIGYMLKINAGAYSFEAANSRHEHEYHIWEAVKLPEDKIILPGVITHASNIVEHPEFIAERIIRFADCVGPENVIASADCGFSSQAAYKTEIDPRVIWAKFSSLSEGAKLASKQLWHGKA
jgi:5-methyltetrahydropteroyltriglutamate--homocysteine methyltransferase